MPASLHTYADSITRRINLLIRMYIGIRRCTYVYNTRCSSRVRVKVMLISVIWYNHCNEWTYPRFDETMMLESRLWRYQGRTRISTLTPSSSSISRIRVRVSIFSDRRVRMWWFRCHAIVSRYACNATINNQKLRLFFAFQTYPRVGNFMA